ncbi:hypothetical protein Emag_005749 [Eimeria magna]
MLRSQHSLLLSGLVNGSGSVSPWTALRVASTTGPAVGAGSSARQAAAFRPPLLSGNGAPLNVSSASRWLGSNGGPRLLSAALPLEPEARLYEQEGEEIPAIRASGDAREDLLPVVRTVVEAASDGARPRGKSFWASQREEAARCVEGGHVSSPVAALLVAAFAKAGELAPPLAMAVGKRFAASLRDARRKALAPPLLNDETADQGPTRSVPTPVNFSAIATLFVAKRDAGLLKHPSVAPVAADLHRELLLCMQPQWDSLAFVQLRRVWLLLGVTAESIGLHVSEARALLAATKKRLRRMQKKGYLCEGADARDSAALLWPLAAVSAATRLPFPPQDLGEKPALFRSLDGPSCAALADTGGNEEGYTGLERLGQRRVGERVLVAFRASAAASSFEELCGLGRDLLLTGRIPRVLWAAFGDAAADALQQQNEASEKQVLSEQERYAAELAQWLRLCGSIS